MKLVLTTISAVVLTGALSVGAAQALPRVAGVEATSAAPAAVETVRLRRGFRTGGYRVYRPYRGYGYGYYGPRYYRPGIGVGIGPFGVGIY